MNLAHHPYWNLAGADTVGAHRLCVAAQTYLPTDAQTLPTGEVVAVQGTPYDFRETTLLPLDTTLDANLCLAPARRAQPVFAARLTANDAPSLEISTTGAADVQRGRPATKRRAVARGSKTCPTCRRRTGAASLARCAETPAFSIDFTGRNAGIQAAHAVSHFAINWEK